MTLPGSLQDNQYSRSKKDENSLWPGLPHTPRLSLAGRRLKGLLLGGLQRFVGDPVLGLRRQAAYGEFIAVLFSTCERTIQIDDGLARYGVQAGF
jgi:hypothetical protein